MITSLISPSFLSISSARSYNEIYIINFDLYAIISYQDMTTLTATKLKVVYKPTYSFFKNVSETQELFLLGLNTVSELFLNGKAIFQLYHGENKLIFKEMMMRSALC